MELIKELLKAVAEYSQLNREEFLETVKKAQTSQQSSEITRLKSRLAEAKKRVQELEKLICYCMEKESITEEDVAVICSEQTENKIFDMINAMAEKKQKKAMELYYDLLALKEPPMRILYLITRQFNLLMQVKELSEEGYSAKTISERLKMAGFIVRNCLRQAEYFSLKTLKEALQDCVRMEEAVKTGRMNDVMSVELLLVKYSS